MTRLKLIALLGVGALLGVASTGGPAMAVEEPPFTTVVRDGAFEVRDYPALLVAEVTVAGNQQQAANRGFRLLAGYIFGGNRRRQTIAMTAPVAQMPTVDRITMTAPVTRARDPETWVVRFTMPRAYALDALPVPDDSRVHLRLVPPSRVAVLRFSGVAGKRDLDEKSDVLAVKARAHGLRLFGRPSLNQYDPPWTPWFMRRNEVAVVVAK